MNTPKPCVECCHLYCDAMREEDSSYMAECSLDLPMGDENCPEFEPLGVNIRLFKDLPDMKHLGKTIGEVNAKKKHNIPLKSLVEIKGTGVRLFVVYQGRDCDNTPLYWLGAELDDPKYKRVGGYSEDELKIIKRKRISVCCPKICRGFKLFPHLLNCISREKGDPRIYRWLWWNWTI